MAPERKDVMITDTTTLDETSSWNTLIAGMTGSGKSYVMNKMINYLMSLSNVQFVIIDPKSTELSEYENNSKTLWYAWEDEEIYDVLRMTYDLMMDRFQKMRADGLKTSNDDHIFIIIDEMTALMIGSHKKEYMQIISQIVILGRSAHVHIIIGCQNANRAVLSSTIRDNIPNKICLCQEDATRYRYILNQSYPELPKIGFAYVKTPDMKRPERVKSEDAWITVMKNN